MPRWSRFQSCAAGGLFARPRPSTATCAAFSTFRSGRGRGCRHRGHRSSGSLWVASCRRWRGVARCSRDRCGWWSLSPRRRRPGVFGGCRSWWAGRAARAATSSGFAGTVLAAGGRVVGPEVLPDDSHRRTSGGSRKLVTAVWFDHAMSNGWQMPGQTSSVAGEWRRSTGRSQTCALPPLRIEEPADLRKLNRSAGSSSFFRQRPPTARR